MTDPIALNARTPRHDLPLLYPGQAQKEVFLNEALARLDALVVPVIISALPAPPVDHGTGDTYLVSEPATGVWTGMEGSLAISQGTHWVFQRPHEGMHIYDRTEAGMRFFGEEWTAPDPVPDPTGGATVDVEARGAIATLLQSLRSLGILSAN